MDQSFILTGNNGTSITLSPLPTVAMTLSGGLTGPVGPQGPKGDTGSAGTSDYNQLVNKPTLSTVATSGSYTDLSNKPAIPTQYTDSQAAAAAPVQSVSGRTGTVTLTKTDVGLSNVDNTSDVNKPVSTATQTALNGKANTTHTHVESDVPTETEK